MSNLSAPTERLHPGLAVRASLREGVVPPEFHGAYWEQRLALLRAADTIR